MYLKFFNVVKFRVLESFMITIYRYIQWNKVITNLIVKEYSDMTNRIWSQIDHFSTQINLIRWNKNGRSRAVRYNRVSL